MRGTILPFVFTTLMMAALLFELGTPAKAVTVQTMGDSATGITDLVVGGQTYNISFEVGTYTDIWGGTVVANGDVILNEIVSVLNAQLSVPTSVNAPSAIPDELFLIPIAFTDPDVSVVAGLFLGSSWATDTSVIRPDISFVWAVPTTITAVPLPAALPLFAGGLGLLGLLGWRRKRRVAA